MRYANIVYNDTVNIDSGVALTVYAQGCPHKCKGCFSPQTWDFEGGLEWTKQDEDNLIYCLKNYKYDWLVLLGGEPMCNLDFCKYFIGMVKKYQKNIKVWCYTGYQLKNIKGLDIMNHIDVLVDGQFQIENQVHGKLYGSFNQNVYRKDDNCWMRDVGI